MAGRRLDLGRTWTDMLAMGRANGDVLFAVSGMFVLLPSMVSTWFLPDGPRLPKGATLAQALNANTDYMSAHWPVMLLSALTVAFGALTVSAVLTHPGRPTVADAMRIGITALPFYALANLIQTVAVSIGLILLVVPGIYLLARLLCIAPVAVAEGRHSPLAIMRRSFQLTRGNGWRIVLLVVVILIVTLIVSTALRQVFGIAGALLLPPDLARFLNIFVNAVIETGTAVTVTLVSVSLYRQATAPDDPTPFG